MGACFVYMKLQLKRTCKTIPSFLAGAIVLAALLGTIALSASKVIYGEAVTGRISVGVVLPEEDEVASLALSMLSSMDSVKSVCDFVYLEADEGRSRLSNGDLNVLMVVPEGFVKDIMQGVNTPVTVVLPENAGMETMIFKELADAGAKTLSVAQAGIYGADEFCMIHGLVDSIPEVESALNRLYMKYALPREDYFRNYQVSAAGDVTMIQYYGISAMVLLLLFCGIPASSVVKPDSLILQQKLKLIGVGRKTMVFSRMVSVAFLMMLILALAGGILSAMEWIQISWWQAGWAIFICFAAASLVVLAYEAAGSQMAGVMLVFLSSVVMMFLSGGFIPMVFLPQGFAEISAFLPSTWLIQAMKPFLAGGLSWMLALKLCLLIAGSYAAAVLVRRR